MKLDWRASCVIGVCCLAVLGTLFYLNPSHRNTSFSDTKPSASTDPKEEASTDNSADSNAAKQEETQRVKSIDAIAKRELSDLISKIQDQKNNLNTAQQCTSLVANCEKAIGNKWITNDDRDFVTDSISFAHNKHGEIQMTLGFEFEKIGNTKQANICYQDADESFKKSILKNNKNWKSFLNRGIIYSKLGNSDKAVANFRRSITLRPGQTFGYFNLAEIEFQRKNYVESLANYDRAIRSSSDDLQAINGRGLCLLELGRFSEAIVEFDKLIAKRPKDPLVLASKAESLQGLGKWKEAKDTYISALKLEQHPQVYQRLAWLMSTCPDKEIRQKDSALFMAQKSISESTLAATSRQWETLAAAQALSGDFEKATESQNQAIRLDPENKELKARKALYESEKPFVMSVATSGEKAGTVKR